MNEPIVETPARQPTSVLGQVSMMRRAFMASPLRNTIFGLGAGILAVILATAAGQIVLNRWNRPFYDAIERRDLDAFLHQLTIFAWIAGVLLILNIAQAWLNQMLRLRLREGLTRDLIGEWMEPRRAFRLANAGPIGANPDQRMHEDAHHLTDLSTDLGVGLVQATVLLVSFVGVLWSLSAGFVFHAFDREFAIPGYMVWAAVLYAGIASCLSWLVGRPLIGLNSDRYAREAELRFSLVRVNEHIDAIALAGGEADERRRLEIDLGAVLAATRRIITATVRLTWITAGYGWITVVAPIVIASPVYFAGDMSFGGLMMAVGAFNQVHSSLRWFVDHIGAIADWRATLLRVADFRAALLGLEALHGGETRIAYGEAPAGAMRFTALKVVSHGGCTEFADGDVSIAAGERVLITAGPGVGKTLFFRAIAGLWPWGSGRIELPAGEAVTFIPRRPYLSPGTLRAALAYPLADDAFKDAELVAALERLGLGRLVGSLDVVGRWERDIDEEEHRLIGFAQLMLHRPRWVVIDEALDALKEGSRAAVLDILRTDLEATAVISLGRGERGATFFGRELALRVDTHGRKLEGESKRRPSRVARRQTELEIAR